MYTLVVLFSLIALSLGTNDNNNDNNPNNRRNNRNETKIIFPTSVCGQNEILTDCVTPCQPSCDFPKQLPCPEFSARSNSGTTPPPQIIIIRPGHPHPNPPSPCSSGCICADGYVRNEFGRCIPKSHCRPQCKPNSHYESCGPRCQPTCDVVEPKSLSHCQKSHDVCVSGCFCNSGYVKDLRTGECVRPKDCSHVCPENEHYSDCGPECEATCHRRHIDWSKCRNHSVQRPGCYCNHGFVRDEVSKRCIREQECRPKTCPVNEEWYKCKPCTRTCDKANPICSQICYSGCDCKNGFVRNIKTNKCIQLCECPYHLH